MDFIKKISWNTALLIILIAIIAGFSYIEYCSNAHTDVMAEADKETFTFSDSVKGVQTQVNTQMLNNQMIPPQIQQKMQAQQQAQQQPDNASNMTNNTMASSGSGSTPPILNTQEYRKPPYVIYKEAEHNKRNTDLYELNPYNDYKTKPLPGSDQVYFDTNSQVRFTRSPDDLVDPDGVINGAYKAHSRTMLPEITLYYAMWCGYSRAFLSEWNKFEQLAKDKLPNIKVSSIRCEGDNENMCIQKGVEGYPTIMLYMYDGRDIKYDGERKAESIVEFVSQYVK